MPGRTNLPEIDVVYAAWCPHCVPTVVPPLQRLAAQGRIRLTLLDIDSKRATPIADRLVRRWGDWAPDYLIPQVFARSSRGGFRHLLTGYPEGVRYTRAGWRRLLRSGRLERPAPRRRASRRAAVTRASVGRLLSSRFDRPSPCSHCAGGSRVTLVVGGRDLLGVQACPSGYVSRLILYSDRPGIRRLHSILAKLLDGRLDLAREDLRVGTRYAWDLGIARRDGPIVCETYWNQNYRRSRVEDPDRLALFHCSECGEFSFQKASSRARHCRPSGRRASPRPRSRRGDSRPTRRRG